MRSQGGRPPDRRERNVDLGRSRMTWSHRWSGGGAWALGARTSWLGTEAADALLTTELPIPLRDNC